MLHEQLDADLAYAYLQKFNGAHYVSGPNGEPLPDGPRAIAAPRPENFGPRPTAADRKPWTHLGIEWMCYGLN